MVGDAMTPIKHILGVGLTLFTVDMADHRHQVAISTDTETARWVAWSLGRAHGVKAWYQESDVHDRELVHQIGA